MLYSNYIYTILDDFYNNVLMTLSKVQSLLSLNSNKFFKSSKKGIKQTNNKYTVG